MTSVSIMQPYFVPYAGYFRLFAATDLFVIYDCVQFPRRGYVHRNRLPDANNNPRWLTLGLSRQSRDTCIRDLRFADDALPRLEQAMARFPSISENGSNPLIPGLSNINQPVIRYIVDLLHASCDALGIPWRVEYSSNMDIDPSLSGQQRILAICQAVDADTYVNAPGGRSLYDTGCFERAGVKLEFLNDFVGSNWSILHRFSRESTEVLRDEIVSRSAIDF